MSKIPKNNLSKYIIIAAVFFLVGSITTYLYLDNIISFKIASENSETEGSTDPISSIAPSPSISIVKYKEITPTVKTSNILKKPSGKFTIVENHKISSNKTTIETGQKVDFSVTLKNQGSEKKFLTHICFNHTGGVTFGCLRNMNLYPGKEFNLNNSMIFESPGTYSIWITWSQDHTNFYRPVNAGTATVIVN